MTSLGFHRTVEAYKQGARTMPGEYYTSTAILEEERARLFPKMWHCVGRATAVGTAGEFLVRDVAGESVIVVRGNDTKLRAFFNTCRHRGTRLCTQAAGQFSETIQCPYHAWTYGIDGRLIGAPHMNEVEGFDKRDYPLHQAAVAEWEGFVFVNVSREPPAFDDDWFAPLIGRLARYELASLAVGHRASYEVKSNWKLVFQNYSECLHCPMIHPELSTMMPYTSGANDLIDGPFLGGYMELNHESATVTGKACGHLVSGSLPEADRRRAYYYTIMPNLLLSIHPDYVNYYLITSLAVDRTLVESEWMFAPSNRGNPGFNPSDAIEFWDITNRQDWAICEQSQLGIQSSRYEPGPYSPRESMPAAWDREYLRLMGRSGVG
jgi:Rieske 2Fe-2S family protein